MTNEEMLNFVTWHFKVGSAVDTRVQLMGGGAVQWEGRLAGPRFDVAAKLSVQLEGREAVGVAQLEAAAGSQIFDMVLGCRLLCPPGRLLRPKLPEVAHAGTGAYLDLPQGECAVEWGEHGSHYAALCNMLAMPDDFAWVPYIADEPDGWRLHARIRSKRGTGFRRFWLFGREILNRPISEGDQTVSTETNARSPLYRLLRAADYREQTVAEPLTFSASIRVKLPEGLIP